jgi:LuxR family maltose regulon positive regulatory protein
VTDSERGGSTGQALRVSGPAFDLVQSKLRRPPVRPGTVRRADLLARLQRDACTIVSVVAPAGYGKTTLLSQWAERNGQAFAWVSLDEADNDPKMLLSYIAAALDAVQPVGTRVFDALASSVSSVPGSVVPRLSAAFPSMTTPVVLVLDDVHLLRNSECRAALSVLADHVPVGSQLVLAGRDRPPLRVARLRAQGQLLEIGLADLTLTRAEAAVMLRAAEVILDGDELAELHRRTEGWPVGLYLAALYLRDGGSVNRVVGSFDGGDRFISEYMQSEFLELLPAPRRAFLTRAAVLERMSGPLCEAVLDLPGAAATLAELARSNLLLVPLDRRGQWYRYHHLFRDMLLAELQRQEPELIPGLLRRAASWCLRNDRAEEALEYSIAAQDVDTVARRVVATGLLAYRQGRVATARRWLGWLDDKGGIEGHPMIAVLASLISATTGRPAEAERWADAADRWQDGNGPRPDDPSATAWTVMLRAVLCRRGIKQMLADADQAVAAVAAGTLAGPLAALLQGIARVLSGDLDGGAAALQEAVSIGDELGSAEVSAFALCEQSLLAIARADWSQAGILAERADAMLNRAGIEDSFATPMVCAVRARTALHRGDIPAARRELVRAQGVRSLLTYALPHMAAQARIELARVHLALGDTAGARTLVREIDEILRYRPGLGTVLAETQALRTRLTAERRPGGPGASSLTAAELRLLPLLSTHLSFPEIAAQMFLSTNTIKSQAVSIYRKLGASSRTQAVARSRELALLEG